MGGNRQPVLIVSVDRDLLELVEEFDELEVVGILDIKISAKVLGFPILGNDDNWGEVKLDFPGLRAVLAIDPAVLRKKLAAHYGLESLVTIISKDAYISKTSVIGHGSVVQRGVRVLPEAHVGLACKINTNATVHHNVTVGDYCTLAPGCMLLGDVFLGSTVYVGAGAIVLPRVRVGDSAVIGAGAVVTSEVFPGTTVVGVPARPVRMV